MHDSRTGEPPRSCGVIEVVCGPMFSGKTEELIRRLRRAQIAKQKVVVLKPQLDDRYADDHVVSHNAQRIPSLQARTAEEIRRHGMDADVIGIDEVQFFGPDIVGAIEELADKGKRVIVAGLDLDYRGVPFEPVPQLLARAEYITKTLAICVVCGHPASRSQRVTQEGNRIVVGSTDHYEARCRACFVPPKEDGQSQVEGKVEGSQAQSRQGSQTDRQADGQTDDHINSSDAMEAAATRMPGSPASRPQSQSDPRPSALH